MHTANGLPREIVTTTACSVVIRLRLTKFDASFLLGPARPIACCVASHIFVQLIVLIDLRYDL